MDQTCLLLALTRGRTLTLSAGTCTPTGTHPLATWTLTLATDTRTLATETRSLTTWTLTPAVATPALAHALPALSKLLSGLLQSNGVDHSVCIEPREHHRPAAGIWTLHYSRAAAQTLGVGWTRFQKSDARGGDHR